MQFLHRCTLLSALTAVGAAQASGQGSWLAHVEERAAATQVNQPHWATPLITGNARVEQGFRADFTKQTTSKGQSTWNEGGSKGLQFIPWSRTELRVSPPAFLIHNYPGGLDGFGDVAFRAKVRMYGSNEAHHNAIASALLSASLPTGKQANGVCCAVLTPSVEFGKGFGPTAFTSAVGGSLPVSGTDKLGRSVLWNTATQWRMGKYVWWELEANAAWYAGGRNDGKQQTFLTPGVVVSRLPLLKPRPAFPNGLAITVGAGEQIAVTHFNTYKRAAVLTGRLRF